MAAVQPLDEVEVNPSMNIYQSYNSHNLLQYIKIKIPSYFLKLQNDLVITFLFIDSWKKIPPHLINCIDFLRIVNYLSYISDNKYWLENLMLESWRIY